MKHQILMAALATVLALPLAAAPTTASASCAGRKMTGTVLGGLGGALIGNSLARGGGGALVGGIGGAVLGHEIARSGCGHYRRTAYYGPRDRDEGERGPARYVYYDDRGQPVAAPGADPAELAYGAAGPGACRTEMRSYYDDRGALVQSPVQVCAR